MEDFLHSGGVRVYGEASMIMYFLLMGGTWGIRTFLEEDRYVWGSMEGSGVFPFAVISIPVFLLLV